MKKVLLLWITAGLLLSSFGIDTSENYTALTEESTITWAAARPGKTHDGTLSLTSGTLVFDGDNLVSGDVKIDMNSITVSDIKPGKMNDRLVGHLKSADFFDVENHQEARYEITGSETKGDQLMIKGNLTLKGITKEVNFMAKVSIENDQVLLEANTFQIDRTEWDIKYRSGKFFDNLKNKLIDDAIDITVKVSAKKSA